MILKSSLYNLDCDPFTYLRSPKKQFICQILGKNTRKRIKTVF